MPNLAWAVWASMMACSIFPAWCLAQTCSASDSSSDQLLFSNGDHLTGKVLAINNESVLFSNSAIGSVVAPWSAVEQLKSSDRSAVITPREGAPPEISARFHNAVVALSDGRLSVKLDDQQPQTLLAQSALSFEDELCLPGKPPATQTRKSPSRLGTTKPGWSFNINAPSSIAFGTTSQETLGGILAVDFYEGGLNHSRLAASGSHNRTWQVGSPFVTTDVFDAVLQQGHSFGINRGGVYGKVETFFNTSLGMALQKSFGVGYYSRVVHGGPFQFNWLADLRYFNERLYAPTGSFNLVGSRFEGQVTYRKIDSTDRSKVKYLVISRTWINPMWNDERALQAFTTLQLSVPFGRSVCLSFTPLEDDYLRNAPTGKRKNYFTSSVGLKIEHGSNPDQRCY